MKISIFGLGYVGAVSAACLAEREYYIIGVDPNPVKVSLLNQGASPIVEAEVSELVARAVRDQRLRATAQAEDAVVNTDISIICVGTPSQSNGNLDMRHLDNACRDIGRALAKKTDFHVVAVRSTVLPGSMRASIIPLLEQTSGKKAGVDFGICHNPEFLRESTAVHDFHHPPKTVIGENDPRSGDLLESLYEGLPGPLIRCPIEVSEMVKYADNAWHAAKIAFANEIGNICKAGGIDSHQVMDIFCQDTKLNLSPYYLRPGFAFGGSCLPKDVRALAYKARSMDIATPLLDSLLPSNRWQVERGLEMILNLGKRTVGILGFSFKAGTDDLRESPLVEVIERLIGKGFDLRLYDSNVQIARLIGANRDYILTAIPHIERLMVGSMDEVLAHGEIIVIGNQAPEFSQVASKLLPQQHVIDFVRIPSIEHSHGNYHGICW